VSCHGQKFIGVWSYVTAFCTKLGKSGSETLQLLRTTYGDAVCPQPVFRWHKAFTDGRESVEEEQRVGLLQLQEMRTMWLVGRLFWLGTGVCKCG